MTHIKRAVYTGRHLFFLVENRGRPVFKGIENVSNTSSPPKTTLEYNITCNIHAHNLNSHVEWKFSVVSSLGSVIENGNNNRI